MKFTLVVIYTLIGHRHDGLTMERKVATYDAMHACEVAMETKQLALEFRRKPLKLGKVTYECRQSSDWWT